MRHPSKRPDLDEAIDAAASAMTDVEALEARSRQRTLARLATPAPIGRPVGRGLAWMTLSAAAAILAWVAVMWTVREPAPKPASDRTARSTPRTPEVVQPAHRVPDVATQARTTTPAPAARRTVMRTRSASQVPHREQPDRLAAFIRAVRQLPPDVWERVDAAAPPPPVPPLAVDEMSTAPITVEPLPASDGSSNPSPPGGPQ
jgi:hypothetical protein